MPASNEKSFESKRVLITSGPTAVSIDKMRVISNRATGELGQRLAKAFIQNGAQVTMLQSTANLMVQDAKVRVRPFFFYDELSQQLKKELSKPFDLVIHNAAVSDYQLKNPFKEKLSSDKKTLHLKLIPTEKIINIIKKSAPKVFLIGFKLEDFKSEKQVFSECKKLFTDAKCDLVVANTLNGGYKAFIVTPDERILSQARSRQDLTEKLLKVLKEKL